MMFRWLLKTRPPKQTRRPTTRLFVEECEARNCPSQVIYLGYQAQFLSGNQVRLEGIVLDDPRTVCTVNFSGAVSGQATTDLDGTFCYDAPASSLGAIHAYAEDELANATGDVEVDLTSAAPQVDGSIAYNGGKSVTLQISVTDEAPSHCTVTVSGPLAATLTPNSMGMCSITADAAALDTIKLSVVDPWGLTGSNAITMSVDGPAINSFSGNYTSDTTWVFNGGATGAGTLTWALSGLPSTKGLSGTMDSSSSFEVGVDFASDESGEVTLTVTDTWGQTATANYLMS